MHSTYDIGELPRTTLPAERVATVGVVRISKHLQAVQRQFTTPYSKQTRRFLFTPSLTILDTPDSSVFSSESL